MVLFFILLVSFEAVLPCRDVAVCVRCLAVFAVIVLATATQLSQTTLVFEGRQG